MSTPEKDQKMSDSPEGIEVALDIFVFIICLALLPDLYPDFGRGTNLEIYPQRR